MYIVDKKTTNLHHRDKIVDPVVTDLFHKTEDTSAEEDFGVAVLKRLKFEMISFVFFYK